MSNESHAEIRRAVRRALEDLLSFTAAGNVRIADVETTYKKPVDIQDHLHETVTILSSGTRTSSGSGSDVNIARFIAGEVYVVVTAVSGTSPSLTVNIEGRAEASGAYKTLCTISGITAAGTYWCSSTLTNIAFKNIRASWTVSGTSPSFTFAVYGEFKA